MKVRNLLAALTAAAAIASLSGCVVVPVQPGYAPYWHPAHYDVYGYYHPGHW